MGTGASCVLGPEARCRAGVPVLGVALWGCVVASQLGGVARLGAGESGVVAAAADWPIGWGGVVSGSLRDVGVVRALAGRVAHQWDVVLSRVSPRGLTRACCVVRHVQ